ncbi:hypothetical protein [Brachybacterium sacelli]|uniref:hypothetical protein n=1 Tax=Brachybacterium sacelli TaxID=173364 RepID=UPI00361E6487
MTLGEDARSITVAGEGTWSLIGNDLVFTPLSGVEGPTTPVALTVGSIHDTRSVPEVFTPEVLELEEIAARGSAGETTDIALDDRVPEGGTVRLELAGLPAGSTLVADGSRATVPEQGVWQLSADGSTLSHAPAAPGLGRQLDPVRVVVEDAEGTVVRAARSSSRSRSSPTWTGRHPTERTSCSWWGGAAVRRTRDPALLPLAGEEGGERLRGRHRGRRPRAGLLGAGP